MVTIEKPVVEAVVTLLSGKTKHHKHKKKTKIFKDIKYLKKYSLMWSYLYHTYIIDQVTAEL